MASYRRLPVVMKNIFVIISIVVAIFFIIVVINGCDYTLNPPKPKITYGEFPFRLTYELDGEIKVIEDTVICEFDGFESRGTAGRYRIWKTSLKSGNERLTLLDLRPLEETNEFGYTMLELFFS